MRVVGRSLCYMYCTHPCPMFTDCPSLWVVSRCGDEIVAVNGATTVGMNNSSLIPMLKLQKNKVTLTVVSWPGSLV